MTLPTLCERIGALRAQLAEAAQGVVCGWDFEDGGACDVVAQDMAGVLGEAGIDSMEGGHDGDDHAWLIAYDSETREACGVDIPPGVYEVGGGYSWQGIEGAVVGPEDIALWPIPFADIEESIEDEYPEARLPNPHRPDGPDDYALTPEQIKGILAPQGARAPHDSQELTVNQDSQVYDDLADVFDLVAEAVKDKDPALPQIIEVARDMAALAHKQLDADLAK